MQQLELDLLIAAHDKTTRSAFAALQHHEIRADNITTFDAITIYAFLGTYLPLGWLGLRQRQTTCYC